MSAGSAIMAMIGAGAVSSTGGQAANGECLPARAVPVQGIDHNLTANLKDLLGVPSSKTATSPPHPPHDLRPTQAPYISLPTDSMSVGSLAASQDLKGMLGIQSTDHHSAHRTAGGVASGGGMPMAAGAPLPAQEGSNLGAQIMGMLGVGPMQCIPPPPTVQPPSPSTVILSMLKRGFPQPLAPAQRNPNPGPSGQILIQAPTFLDPKPLPHAHMQPADPRCAVVQQPLFPPPRNPAQRAPAATDAQPPARGGGGGREAHPAADSPATNALASLLTPGQLAGQPPVSAPRGKEGPGGAYAQEGQSGCNRQVQVLLSESVAKSLPGPRPGEAPRLTLPEFKQVCRSSSVPRSVKEIRPFHCPNLIVLFLV